MAPKTAHLTIHPSKPFKSSRLALPPSPFSPRLPLSPPPHPPPTTTTTHQDPAHHHHHCPAHPPPPPEPLHWLWQCHLCARVYRLATTRRCLDDGHYFCAGTTTLRRSRRGSRSKVVRHKACASEFDYRGWKAWGVWRRSFDGAGVVRAEGEDCWRGCDYPSECRWGKQYGVATPTLPAAPPTGPGKEVATSTTAAPPPPATRFEDILLAIPVPTSSTADEDGDVAMQSPPLSPTGPDAPESREEPTRQPSLDDLVSSAVRRKRRSLGATGVVAAPSPLASHPPRPTAEHVENVESGGGGNEETALQRAFEEFDVEFRRSFERAGARLTGLVGAVRGKGEEGKKGWL